MSIKPPPYTTDLIATLVELCGLSAMLGPGTVRRALRDVGVDTTDPKPQDCLRALPNLAARMRAFQTEDETSHNLRRVEDYLRGRLALNLHDDNRA